MNYRIMINVWVEKKDDAKKIYDIIKSDKAKFKSANKRERWSINYHKCFHDEAVNKPCEIIEEDSDKEA